MADRKLSITITGDASKAKKALADLDKSVGRSAKNTKSAGQKMQSTLAGFGLAAGLIGVSKAYDESAKVAGQSEAVLKSTGNTAHTTSAAMADLAGSISKKTGIDDESIQAGENMLAMFKGVQNQAGKGNDIFDQATRSVVDLSVAMATDSKSAAKVLGRALDDPIGGLGKLAKANVRLDSAQKAQVKSLVESGDKLGAQKIILEEVNRTVGGSAEKQATGMGKAKVAVDNLAESLGGALAPAVGTAANVIGVLADGLGALPAPAQQGAIFAAAGAVAWVKWGDSLKDLGPKIKNVATGISNLASAAKPGGPGLSGVSSGVQTAGKASIVAAAGVGAFVGTLELLNNAVRSNVNLSLLRKNLEGIGDGTKNTSTVFAQFGGSAESLAGKINQVNNAVDTSVWEDFQHVMTTGGGLMRMTEGQAKKTQNQLADLDGTLAGMVSDGNVQAARDAFGKLSAAVIENGGSAEDLARTFPDYFTAIDGVAGATLDAKGAQEQQSISSQAQAKALGELATAAEDAGNRIKDFYDKTTSGLSTQIQAEAAVDALTASFKENGLSMDIGTEKGRNNEQALISLKDAAVANALAVREQTGSSDEAAKSLQGYADKLALSAKAAGATDGQIALMIAQMHLTPKEIQTVVHSNATAAETNFRSLAAQIYRTPGEKKIYATMSGAEKAKDDLRVLNERSASKTMVITVAVRNGQKVKQFASGTDSAPAGLAVVGEEGPELVSFGGGERVHTAAATSRMLAGSSSGAPLAGRSSRPASGSSSLTVNVSVAGSVISERDLTSMVIKGINEAQKRSTRPILAGVS